MQDELEQARTMVDTPPSEPKKTVQIGPPHMWPEEITALTRLLKAVRLNYLEFGTGGSTLLAVRTGIAKIVAVESDPAWAAAVRSHPEVAPRVADGRAVVLHADIGAVANFGSPASATSARRWPAYISTAWAEWARGDAFPELVLVDGRFRVACCLSVIVARALMRYPGADPLVVMHDVTPDRPSYDRALEFFDVVDEVRSLRTMRIKRDASAMQAFLLLLELQFDGQ